MVQLLLIIGVLGVPGNGAGAGSEPHPPESPRSFHAITRDVRSAMRAEAGATDASDRVPAILELTELCAEISRDARLPASPTLKRLRGKVISRLRRVKQNLERELHAKKDRADTPPSIGVIEGVVAAQVGNVGGARPARPGPPPRAGAVARDYGQVLVELIERTISPETWDVNGGPATIVYYAPLRVLVVRAPSEIHGSVGGLLGGLREVGGP